jgi:hypothetical protein
LKKKNLCRILNAMCSPLLKQLIEEATTSERARSEEGEGKAKETEASVGAEAEARERRLLCGACELDIAPGHAEEHARTCVARPFTLDRFFAQHARMPLASLPPSLSCSFEVIRTEDNVAGEKGGRPANRRPLAKVAYNLLSDKKLRDLLKAPPPQLLLLSV